MAARKTPKARRKAARPTGRPRRKTRTGTQARRKPARRAARTTRRRPTARSGPRKGAAARRAATRRPKAVKKAVKKALEKAVEKAKRPQTGKSLETRPKQGGKRAAPKRSRRRATPPPDLDRARKRLPDVERLEAESGKPAERLPASEDRDLLSARAGHDELRHRLRLHTETSPELTAGDVDARWEDAYAVGDEAPGGDNPTPDQDRVDDIGRALGIRYDDRQELKGGDEITERDRHRWEYDPASSEDWPRKKD